jgi:hypothetical protein
MVLMLKSIAPAKAAETGIFNLQNGSLGGFQQGSSGARPDQLLVTLYSDDGNVEFTLWQRLQESGRGLAARNKPNITVSSESPDARSSGGKVDGPALDQPALKLLAKI